MNFKSFHLDIADTPASMNGLFSDLFMEFCRGDLGGGQDYLGVDCGRFSEENSRKMRGHIEEIYPGKVGTNPRNPI